MKIYSSNNDNMHVALTSFDKNDKSMDCLREGAVIRTRVMLRQISDLDEDDCRIDTTSSSSSCSSGSQSPRRSESSSSLVTTTTTATAATTVMSTRDQPVHARSASTIRSRLLMSLGINNNSSCSIAKPLSAVSPPRPGLSHRQRQRSPSYEAPLKGDYGRPSLTPPMTHHKDSSSTCCSSSNSSCSSSHAPLSASLTSTCPGSSYDTTASEGAKTKQQQQQQTTRKTRGVSFDRSVTVHPIPSFRAYSDRIKCHLWTSPVEMQENAARNCFEFAAEGWDWQNVVDDEHMVNYQGEKLHPIHFELGTGYSLRNQLMTVMSSQTQQQQL